ncbi:GMC oxidoreductase [Venturia nashicola]|uniref:GMC oxidoreductase n=1 Tax=Venturia nashicola TaxID=86259 RepID=A0A4Z1PQP5_9PEZI|nr:GMC oxidoreductase [Venturia nashicola]
MSGRAKNGTVLYHPSAFDLTGRPLQIGWPNYADPFLTWAQDGMAAAGIPISTLNFNSGSKQWMTAATCKLGEANDALAVVDSNARVFGVEGLRVVDAFLFLTPGHPQSGVYMLAEKIADNVLKGK